MKLIKMVLFAAFVPTLALAQQAPQPTDPNEPSEPSQPSQPTQESGGNMPDHDTGTGMANAMAFGVTAKALPADKRSTYGGPKDAGLLVTKVEAGSPASAAGIKVGDIITKVDDTPMATTDDLTKAWKQGQKGEKSTAEIEVFRDHQSKDLQVNLAPKSGQREAPKGGN